MAEEHEHLSILRTQQEELRLFLGDLRLFDETGMPPAGRSGGGGDQGPGCEPAACSITGSSPADVPLAHFQPEDASGVTSMTPSSLARFHEQLVGHLGAEEPPEAVLARDDRVVTREVGLGVGFMGFHGEGNRSSALGPKAGTSLVFTWPLTGSTGLTVEPSVGGRTLRVESSLVTELAGEVRETLTGGFGGGRSRWQVTSWQKGRFLSKSLSSPGYLEPGRVEGGVVGRFSLPLGSRWEVNGESGVDGVRYEPEDWQVLDRHGLNGALGVGWRGMSRSGRVTVRASHHEFPSSLAEWEDRRKDTRLGVEMNGSLEGRWVLRLSVGGSWNQSRLAAYDFRSGRAALVLSAPMGKGSVQGYAALAHQVYLNPGPEGARVAPSDQDSGAILSLQYTRPLDATHMLLVRGGWLRSQTGFRDDFYERLGISVHLTFRGS